MEIEMGWEVFVKNFSVADFICVGFCSSRVVLCVLIEATLIGDAQSRERAYRVCAETEEADGSGMFVWRKIESKVLPRTGHEGPDGE